MSYYMATTSSRPFEAVLTNVVDALRAEGFGILTDIDVQSTLKAKIGAEIPKYRILGACNPRLAHEGLRIESKLGVLLPCNVVVRETPEGQVEVASVDPVAAMERTGNASLAATAASVKQGLARVLAAVAP
jgi:uncharacterized protein (DUF302 family)